jgi:hypothetical protein
MDFSVCNNSPGMFKFSSGSLSLKIISYVSINSLKVIGWIKHPIQLLGVVININRAQFLESANVLVSGGEVK